MTPPNHTHIDAHAGPRPGQFTAMISSTALDLPEHRKLVHQACLDAEVFPVGMEQLPARDASGIDASLEMVDKADIYIGVYAFRYGWVPEGEDVSITEMEFDRASERKAEGSLHEILVFTAHEEHAFTARDVEASEAAQEKLRKFKARAAEGRVRKEFKSAEELRRLVLQALNDFKNRQQRAVEAATNARPAHTTIPHNLPRLQPFFGREDELAQIREALDPENRTWGALIDGPGGMGKTSLAVRAAYDCTPDDFNRIVFVSVKNRELDDDGLRELGVFVLPGFLEMLNELSRELGRADITKAPEDDRIRLLLDALRDETASSPSSSAYPKAAKQYSPADAASAQARRNSSSKDSAARPRSKPYLTSPSATRCSRGLMKKSALPSMSRPPVTRCFCAGRPGNSAVEVAELSRTRLRSYAPAPMTTIPLSSSSAIW